MSDAAKASLPAESQDGARDDLGSLRAELASALAAADELRRSNADLEARCSAMVHDLRGPLASLVGFSEVLTQRHSERLDPQGQRMVQIIRENTARLGQLIDDFVAVLRGRRNS